MKSYFLSMLCLVLASSSAFAGSTYDQSLATADAIKKACQKRVDAGLYQGAAIALITGTDSSDSANGENSIFCGDVSSNHDVFELGSVSKSFAGIALAKFAVENRIDLDHPISEYVPELAESEAGKITPRQLATHTAGLAHDYTGSEQPWLYDSKGLIANLKSTAPSHVGTRNYSNLGFGVIALVLSRITGRTYQQVIQSEVLDPLRMNETEFNTRTVPPKNLVDGHGVLLNAGQVMQLSDYAVAAGGITSDIHDMMLYLRANLHPDDSFLGQAMTLSQSQGLGWDSLPGKLPTWKNGAMTDGFSSIIEFDATKGVGVVVLGDEFNAPAIQSLGDVAMGGKDSFEVTKLQPELISMVSGEYVSTDKKTIIDISAFRQSFLGAQLRNATTSEYVRFLSIGKPAQFAVDDGVSTADQIAFATNPANNQVYVAYYSFVKTDATGKPVYKTTIFQRNL